MVLMSLLQYASFVKANDSPPMSLEFSSGCFSTAWPIRKIIIVPVIHPSILFKHIKTRRTYACETIARKRGGGISLWRIVWLEELRRQRKTSPKVPPLFLIQLSEACIHFTANEELFSPKPPNQPAKQSAEESEFRVLHEVTTSFLKV